MKLPRRRHARSLLPVALVLPLLLTGCRPKSAADSPELVLFAAASLTDAMDGLIAGFEARHPGVTIQPNYASSGQLAVQLSQGISADLFASADQARMSTALAAGRIQPPVYPFASNELVILIPAGNPAGIDELADLGEPGLRLLLATPDAPLRTYTDQALDRLAAESPQGQQLRQRILANTASEEDNARQVVAKIALGEADAALAYRSDAFGGLAQDVDFLPLPPDLRVEALYPIAVVEGAPHAAWARRFIGYVLSPEGQQILRQWGFGEAPADG